MSLRAGDWGLAIGDWGLGIGDWGLEIMQCRNPHYLIANPQSPIPNPLSPIPNPLPVQRAPGILGVLFDYAVARALAGHFGCVAVVEQVGQNRQRIFPPRAGQIAEFAHILFGLKPVAPGQMHCMRHDQTGQIFAAKTDFTPANLLHGFRSEEAVPHPKLIGRGVTQTQKAAGLFQTDDRVFPAGEGAVEAL
ncbi:MAG: hypothetical protein DWI57_15500 [Chloroflexi bacterium]|nr:MAG: hypothetical protein DWI57_15500 [Chloroflexota bacterium]